MFAHKLSLVYVFVSVSNAFRAIKIGFSRKKTRSKCNKNEKRSVLFIFLQESAKKIFVSISFKRLFGTKTKEKVYLNRT